MSIKLRIFFFFFADCHLGGRVSLLTVFWLEKHPFLLQCCENPGVTLDAAPSFYQHVSAVVRSCFFIVRSLTLSKVSPYLTRKAANSIAVSLILSKLACWNSLLAGLPQAQIKHLQAAQKSAARTITKCKKTDHITSILRFSERLPVHSRFHH